MKMTNKEDVETNKDSIESENAVDFKVYKKRWLILFLFMFYMMTCNIQLVEFAVIADVITEYYQVPYDAVNWTVLIGSVAFIVVSFPALPIIDKLGCRKSVIIGAIGIMVGTWIKVGAVSPDRFWIILFGQAIISIFQMTILPLLPKIAAIWFGYNEIATACGCSFVAIQLGAALSFVIPPLLVSKEETLDVDRGLYMLSIIYGVLTSIAVPLLILFFSEAPPTPPSISQQYVIKEKLANPKTLFQTCKTLLTNKQYIILTLIFGVNVAILWPLQIISNQVILFYYPGATYDVGVIGLLQTLVSVIGSMSASFVLDKYKKYKETCWLSLALYLISVTLYIGTISQGLVFVYVTNILIGIISGAMGTLTFELIAEFSYPESESVSITLYFIWTQLVSIGLTNLFQYILQYFSVTWANVMLVASLVVVDLLFFVLKFDLRRKAMQDSKTIR